MNHPPEAPNNYDRILYLARHLTFGYVILCTINPIHGDLMGTKARSVLVH